MEDSEVFKRMAIAYLVALFVQWSTTGSAIVMAYLTPTVGLGCRSGGYLIYGLAGNGVLFLMVLSMIFSHFAMKRYQSHYNKWSEENPNGNPRGSEEEMFKGLRYSLLCILAVVTRVLGKTLAVLSTIFLIASSLFEYLGVYSNCWCKSAFPQWGHSGWVVLFKTDQDFQRVAQGPWVGGVAMSTIACIIAWAVFAFAPQKTK
jgi:hypothetical protein